MTSPSRASTAKPSAKRRRSRAPAMVVFPDEGNPVNQTVMPDRRCAVPSGRPVTSAEGGPGAGCEARSAGGPPCSQAFLSNLIKFSGNPGVRVGGETSLNADDGGGAPPPSSPPARCPTTRASDCCSPPYPPGGVLHEDAAYGKIGTDVDGQ